MKKSRELLTFKHEQFCIKSKQPSNAASHDHAKWTLFNDQAKMENEKFYGCWPEWTELAFWPERWKWTSEHQVTYPKPAKASQSLSFCSGDMGFVCGRTRLIGKKTSANDEPETARQVMTRLGWNLSNDQTKVESEQTRNRMVRMRRTSFMAGPMKSLRGNTQVSFLHGACAASGHRCRVHSSGCFWQPKSFQCCCWDGTILPSVGFWLVSDDKMNVFQSILGCSKSRFWFCNSFVMVGVLPVAFVHVVKVLAVIPFGRVSQRTLTHLFWNCDVLFGVWWSACLSRSSFLFSFELLGMRGHTPVSVMMLVYIWKAFLLATIIIEEFLLRFACSNFHD